MIQELNFAQIALIKKPLPLEAVKPHPTKQGMSAIKPIYVTERLNEVFGIGAWQIETDLLPVSADGSLFTIKDSVTKSGNPRREYFAVAKTVLSIPTYGIRYECIAGAGNDDAGDAAKGATTDAITKICSYLGIGIDVFKGQHEQAAKAYAEQEKKDQLDKAVERAIECLADCKTIADLTTLRESLEPPTVRDSRFQKVALSRFNEVKALEEQPAEAVAA